MLVQRALPTPPSTHGSKSLYLTEADLLEIPGEWVVQVLRVSYSTEEVPIHAIETICAASRHTFPIGQAVSNDQF